MHAASPTYTPVHIRTAVATLLFLLLASIATGQETATEAPSASGHYRAPIQWTLETNETFTGSNGTVWWTQVADQIVSFSARTDSGASYTCHGTNGTVHDRNGTATEGNCAIQQEPALTFAFADPAENERWEATLAGNVTNLAHFDVETPAPSSIPGFIVLFLGVAFFLATVALGVLYVRERRMSHFLVRRLYEETKGRMPADWPENMRQQWIARIFIRGKN